jgi:hypothetical protein
MIFFLAINLVLLVTLAHRAALHLAKYKCFFIT